MIRLTKLVIYKLYVLALLAFVVWSAQFIYTIIFWEFELKGETNTVKTSQEDSPLIRQRKIREYLDKYTRTRSLDLGDTLIKEQYETNHFHHVGQIVVEPVLNGCDYCHTNLAHNSDQETRSFLNQHGYFVSCETCHYDSNSVAKILSYDWIKVDSGDHIVRPLAIIQQTLNLKKSLPKAKGNVGARIAPWVTVKEKKIFLTSISKIDEAKDLLDFSESYPASDIKNTLRRIHKGLRKNPIECDACHEKNSDVIPFAKLGYPQERVKELSDSAIVGMISKYKQFHFPNLFIRKDDREGTNKL